MGSSYVFSCGAKAPIPERSADRQSEAVLPVCRAYTNYHKLSKTFDQPTLRVGAYLFEIRGLCRVPIDRISKGLVMEFLSVGWWSALATIILIDLVLAGDNAIVIALAARRLPAHLQRRAILWGTAGAIIVRSLMTVGVVWLLKIPGLMLAGGLGLLWIAYKLLADTGDDDHETGGGATTFWGAMKTIIIADALMGIDNVLGVAGAAGGAFDLVILGLLISVPIVVFGSAVVLKLVQRWPIIIQLGAAVLAFTGAQMIINETLLDPVFDGSSVTNDFARWGTYLVSVAGVLGLGWWSTRRREPGTRAESI